MEFSIESVKKILLVEKIWYFSLNWGYILAFVTFWSYGLFASIRIAGQTNFFNAVVLGLLFSALMLYFVILGLKCSFFQDTLCLSSHSILIAFFYCAVFGFLSYPRILYSIVSDEIIHSELSQSIGITIIYKVADIVPVIQNYPFNSFLWLFNIFLFCALLICISLWYKYRNNLFTYLILVLLFVLTRGLFIEFVPYIDQFPPMRLFPLWVSSTIFSPTSFSFHIPSFIGLIVLITYIHQFLAQKTSHFFAGIICLAIGTIPLLLHVSLIVEQSIWTCLIWTILLLLLSTDLSKEKPHFWIRLISITSVFALCRISLFLGLIPIILTVIYYNFEDIAYLNTKKIKYYILLFSPIIVFLPYLFSSYFGGYWALQSLQQGTEQISLLTKVLESIQSGFGPTRMIEAVLIPWAGFFFIAFFGFSNRKKLFSAAIFLLLFILSYSLFVSGGPTFHSIESGRYASEYFLPFVIFGFIQFMLYGYDKKTVWKGFVVVIAIGLIIFNLGLWINLYERNSDTGGFIHHNGIISRTPFAYDETLNEIKTSDYSDKHLILGYPVRLLREMMAGYSIREILGFSKQLKLFQSRPDSYNSLNLYDVLNKTNNTSLFILNSGVDAYQYPLNDILYLQKHGWIKWREFEVNESGTILVAMVKN
jgi:hypothetical protein